jgi:alpha-L-fucosidase
MVLEMAIVFTVGVTGGTLPVADKTPYESVNKSEKLYSDNAVQTIKGVITDTKTVTLKDGAEFMQMDVETDRGTIPVHLGPTWYMNEYAERFDVNKGRSVSVIGSQSTVQGKEVLVASELTDEAGKQHMRLRHPGGLPAWVGSEKTE